MTSRLASIPESQITLARLARRPPAQLADLGLDLGRVRLACADHELHGRIDVGGGPQQDRPAPSAW